MRAPFCFLSLVAPDLPPLFQGYEARRTIRFVLRDLSRYDDLLRGLIKNGVNRIDRVTFGSDAMVTKRKEARTLAIRAAREKASVLAAEVGQSLGRPLTISEKQPELGVNPLANIAYTRGFGLGDNDMSTLQTSSLAPRTLTVSASVEVTFLLER